MDTMCAAVCVTGVALRSRKISLRRDSWKRGRRRAEENQTSAATREPRADAKFDRCAESAAGIAYGTKAASAA